MNLNVNNLKVSFAALIAGAALSTQVFAQAVSTPVVGFVTTTLAAGSDSLIVPQVLRPSELSVSVSSLVSSNGQATLNIGSSSLTVDQFKYQSGAQPKVYVARVTSGNLTGNNFVVSSNTQSSITIDLDGAAVSSSDITGIEVSPCWSLKTLFPSSDSGKSFTPSTGISTAARRTQLLLPNFAGTGVNRAAADIYFFNPAVNDWVSTSATSTPAGDTAILPGQYLIHRNIGGTPVNLSVTIPGGVLAQPFRTYLGTLTNGQNDNPMALPRATDYLVSELGLNDSNFVQSTGTSTGNRRDQLLVFNPTGSGINRAATVIYFRFNNNWHATANPTVAVSNPVIPAGAAVFVRKFASDGNDKILVNQSNVSL